MRRSEQGKLGFVSWFGLSAGRLRACSASGIRYLCLYLMVVSTGVYESQKGAVVSVRLSTRPVLHFTHPPRLLSLTTPLAVVARLRMRCVSSASSVQEGVGLLVEVYSSLSRRRRSALSGPGFETLGLYRYISLLKRGRCTSATYCPFSYVRSSMCEWCESGGSEQ